MTSKSLLDEAITGAQNDVNGRQINWKIAPLPEVEADSAMLRQVWVNLIQNAVKYTRASRDLAEIEVGVQGRHFLMMTGYFSCVTTAWALT